MGPATVGDDAAHQLLVAAEHWVRGVEGVEEQASAGRELLSPGARSAGRVGEVGEHQPGEDQIGLGHWERGHGDVVHGELEVREGPAGCVDERGGSVEAHGALRARGLGDECRRVARATTEVEGHSRVRPRRVP
jgi:hypothetical protein